MLAQEGALKEVANSKVHRALAYNKSFEFTDVTIGDTALSHEAVNRRITTRGRGPAEIQDMDETGVAVKFQSQTFKVAPCCVRKKVGEKFVGKWNGARRRVDRDQWRLYNGGILFRGPGE